ncbi:hypothetical protein BT96DRAFT_926574 [Gymnopus androsaceus JB14]|uniref:Uncharacterized protein n=1 Tax=Gymnopus androsaceus JB14 TaxID=1447944 RepID=A0A6A4GUC7_9AGAR|nr:hypothetical protein BT96DRAFT_926574 [Gymnopus androsaceus JB14]
MFSVAEDIIYYRGRIDARDLSMQHPKFINDYAARYDIPSSLPVNEIVDRIFEGKPEFIPILPYHTWALEGDHVVLTERKDPPTHPHYLALPSDNQLNPLGHAFPDPPEDTYSRSPSPAPNHGANALPSPPPRLPLVFPPVGLPFPVDASGNRPEGTQPVPDDWLAQMLANYEKDHEGLAVELKDLTEETKDVSADVVRVLGIINQERADTRRLMDAVRAVCGQDLLNEVMKDVYSTTNFEMNKKLGASGLTFRSVLYPEGAGAEGKIRSKRITNDKQIFTAEGGSNILLDHSQPSRSAVAAASASPESIGKAAPSGQSKGKKRSSDDTSDPVSGPMSPIAPQAGPSTVMPLAGPPTAVLPAPAAAASSTSTQPARDTQPSSGNASVAAPVAAPPPFNLWGPNPFRRPRAPSPPRPHRPERVFVPYPLPNADSSIPSTRWSSHIVIPPATDPSSSSSSGQATAGPSQQQPERRRPTPLARNYERIIQHSDGTFEAQDYRTPEYLEAMARTEREIAEGQEAHAHLVYESIMERCEPRYCVLIEETDGELYQTYPPQ